METGLIEISTPLESDFLPLLFDPLGYIFVLDDLAHQCSWMCSLNIVSTQDAINLQLPLLTIKYIGGSKWFSNARLYLISLSSIWLCL